MKHSFGPNDKHRKDFDASKLKNARFDDNFVLSVRMRVFRNLRGFCLPSFCTRGERRDIEAVLLKSLDNLDKSKYAGIYFSLADMSKDDEQNLINVYI